MISPLFGCISSPFWMSKGVYYSVNPIPPMVRMRILSYLYHFHRKQKRWGSMCTSSCLKMIALVSCRQYNCLKLKREGDTNKKVQL